MLLRACGCGQGAQSKSKSEAGKKSGRRVCFHAARSLTGKPESPPVTLHLERRARSRYDASTLKPALRVSVVIPAWNEAATIGGVVKDTQRVLGGEPALSLTIVVVDNASTDDTAATGRSQGATVVSEPQRGYGRACLTGIAATHPCDVVVFMDADGSDDPGELPLLIRPIQEGSADFVIGSRELGVSEDRAHPWHAVLGTRLCVGLMNLIIGTQATDLGPFRAISSAALARLGMTDTTFGWTVEMQMKAHRAGLRTVEVPVNYRRRQGGKSKISGSWTASTRAGTRILSLILRTALKRAEALHPRQS